MDYSNFHLPTFIDSFCCWYYIKQESMPISPESFKHEDWSKNDHDVRVRVCVWDKEKSENLVNLILICAILSGTIWLLPAVGVGKYSFWTYLHLPSHLYIVYILFLFHYVYYVCIHGYIFILLCILSIFCTKILKADLSSTFFLLDQIRNESFCLLKGTYCMYSLSIKYCAFSSLIYFPYILTKNILFLNLTATNCKYVYSNILNK